MSRFQHVVNQAVKLTDRPDGIPHVNRDAITFTVTDTIIRHDMSGSFPVVRTSRISLTEMLQVNACEDERAFIILPNGMRLRR